MKDKQAKPIHQLLLACAALFVAVMAPVKVRAAPVALDESTLLGPRANQPEDRKIANLPEVRQALEKFQRRDHQGCLELLEKAKRKHDELPPAPLMLARLFLAKQQLPEARSLLERTATEFPKHPGVHVTFGTLALAEGRLTDASLQLERARSLSATQETITKQQKQLVLVECQKGLSAVAERRRDWKSAQTELTAWLKLDPKNAQARQRLARALFALDQQDDAHKELTQAFTDDAQLEPAAVTMAWLHEKQGSHEKAEEWMQDALERLPEHPRVHQGYAAWLLERDRAAEAKKHLELALKFKAESRELTLLQGQVARALQQYDEAAGHFRAVHEKSPADFIAANLLALSLVEQKDDSARKHALQLAEVNARQYPRAAEALSTLGWVRYQLGDLDRAEQALQAAVSTGTSSSETAYYLAHVMLDRGRLDVVKELLQSAVDAPGLFLHRSDCQRWLERLSKSPESRRGQ